MSDTGMLVRLNPHNLDVVTITSPPVRVIQKTHGWMLIQEGEPGVFVHKSEVRTNALHHESRAVRQACSFILSEYNRS